jgi:AraC-like DNA-binding protein
MNKNVRLIKKKQSQKQEIFFERKTLISSSSVHWHDFYEIELILSGHGTTMINGKKHLLKKGTISFLSPSDFHDISSCELEIFNIQFSENCIDHEIINTLIHLSSRICHLDEIQTESIHHLCELLENAQMNTTYLKMYYQKILESILLIFLQTVHTDDNDTAQAAPDIIQQVVVYLNMHFMENPLLRDIAAQFHLNENYLCTLFKEQTGETYKNYLRRLKLNYAEKQILYTNLSITEIAFSSGYSTLSHFNREFKSMFQIAPLQLRKQSKLF